MVSVHAGGYLHRREGSWQDFPRVLLGRYPDRFPAHAEGGGDPQPGGIAGLLQDTG